MTHSEFIAAAAAAAKSPVVSRTRLADRVIAAPANFAELQVLVSRTKELPSTYIGRSDYLWVKRDANGTRADSNYDLIRLSSVMQYLTNPERRNSAELSWHIADVAPIVADVDSSASNG